MVEEDDKEKRIEDKLVLLAMTTLGVLKDIFTEEKLDDRTVTLTLFYFMRVFMENGWKGKDIYKVTEGMIECWKYADKVQKGEIHE